VPDVLYIGTDVANPLVLREIAANECTRPLYPGLRGCRETCGAVAGGGQEPAIGAERHRVDPVGVAAERVADRLAGAGVPQADGAVVVRPWPAAGRRG
jgi:hypothetical protein